MKKMSIQHRKKKRSMPTADPKQSFGTYPNIVKDLVINSTDQLCCADITYIRILSLVCLAALIDEFSRKIVGYALGRLKMAIRARNTDNLIRHPDEGIQYCSNEYINLLKLHQNKIPISGKGGSCDNAYIEASFKTLKEEGRYLREYETCQDMIDKVTYFTQDIYKVRGYIPQSVICRLRNLKIYLLKTNTSIRL